MSQLVNADWKLKALNIQFMEYGDYKGKYTGTIQFQNNENEAFTFRVRPNMAQDYLNLIKNELVSAAGSLGEQLLQSLNLLPAPDEKKQIGEVIESEPVNS
jgi:hypothetical protein